MHAFSKELASDTQGIEAAAASSNTPLNRAMGGIPSASSASASGKSVTFATHATQQPDNFSGTRRWGNTVHNPKALMNTVRQLQSLLRCILTHTHPTPLNVLAYLESAEAVKSSNDNKRARVTRAAYTSDDPVVLYGCYLLLQLEQCASNCFNIWHPMKRLSENPVTGYLRYIDAVQQELGDNEPKNPDDPASIRTYIANECERQHIPVHTDANADHSESVPYNCGEFALPDAKLYKRWVIEESFAYAHTERGSSPEPDNVTGESSKEPVQPST